MKLLRKTVQLKPSQNAFLKRKKKELRRQVLPGQEGTVTESSILRGLVDYWMALEKSAKSSQ